MTTWQGIAAARGFTDLGNRTWTAPNGQTVAEGFVQAVCRPELVEVEGMALAPTDCQRADLRRHSARYISAGDGTGRHAVHRILLVRDVEAGGSNPPSPTQVRLPRRQRMPTEGEGAARRTA